MLIRFHSLQTGKCIQSDEFGMSTAGINKFPFPSNGKVYSKLFIEVSNVSFDYHEFPFPSNGKVYSEFKMAFDPLAALTFPFPSNGKVYSENATIIKSVAGSLGFPFPSNGKVYSELRRYADEP